MKKIKNIIFDLDGTLIDPKIGITKSLQYAMEKMGLAPLSMDELQWFIGPPLKETFREIIQTEDPAKIAQAIVFYREYYGEKGKFEHIVYPEITEILTELKAFEKKSFVATSKALIFANQIIEHFSLKSFFSGVYGAGLDNSLVNKGELLAYLLKTENLNPADCVMIGDREHDIIGAKKNGMLSIAVTYGYGKEEILRAENPDKIVHSPRELLQLLI